VEEVGERYRLNHAIVVKLYHPVYSNFPLTFAYISGESLLFQCIVTFLLHVINTFTYLLISFSLINMSVLRNNLQTTWWENLCYTQMKAYDVTKRTAELKSNTVRYYLAACLVS